MIIPLWDSFSQMTVASTSSIGSPSAVSGAALAKVMGSDHQLTGEVTLMTSLLSAFTFFIAFTLLRSVALI